MKGQLLATLVLLVLMSLLEDSSEAFLPSSQCTFTHNPVGLPRRRSAAGEAAFLRRRSMVTPDSPRRSLPAPKQALTEEQIRSAESKKTESPIAKFAEIINPPHLLVQLNPLPPLPKIPSEPPVQTPPPATAANAAEPSTPGEVIDISDSPKVNRSGKKRKLIVGALEKKPRKMSKSTSCDAEAMDKLTALIKGLEQSLAKTEANMTQKIEQSARENADHLDKKLGSLSSTLQERIDKTEAGLSGLEAKISDTQIQVQRLRAMPGREEIKKMIDAAVGERLGAGEEPRPSGANRQGQRPRPIGLSTVFDVEMAETSTPIRPEANHAKDDHYWTARKQLRVWPVTVQDPEASVRTFLQERLRVPMYRIQVFAFEVEVLPLRPGQAQQAIVTFGNYRWRDEVRAHAKNLGGTGDNPAGCQLEPPDHLKAHYQTFQSLAYCIKKKNPGLKRNIKFEDERRTLVMDLKIDDEWRTVEYEDARKTLRNRRTRTQSISAVDLGPLLNNSDVASESGSDNDTIIENDNTQSNKKVGKSSNRSMSFINTNARSLGPKTQALADCFDELGLDFGIVTETWMQSNTSSSLLVDEFRDKHSLGLILRNRTAAAANGRQYGGIALAWRNKTSSFKEFKVQQGLDYEVLACVGAVKGVKDPVAVVACYMPPGLTRMEGNQMIEYISDVVAQVKRANKDCCVIVTGDFNQWPVEEIMEEHMELREADVGETRGHRSIDRVFTNFHRSVVESDTRLPLSSEEGNESDHKIAYIRAVFPRSSVKTISYTYRPFTEQGVRQFVNILANADWEPVLSVGNPSDKVVAFQSIVENGMNTCFPTKTTTRREDDPPWINEKIRALGRRRRREYDRNGRSRRWRRLKKKTAEIYRRRAAVYLESQRANLTGPSASRCFFKHVKAYSSKEKPQQFEVGDLFPDCGEEEVAEKLADHFNKISNEFDGLEEDDIPEAHSLPLPEISATDVEERIKKIKKPKSYVSGDMFPALLNRVAAAAVRTLCPSTSVKSEAISAAITVAV